MKLIEKLKYKALQRGLIETHSEIDLKMAYYLVRDMPYCRASNREPKTLISEWRGTCSGKHYLLKALFLELGYHSRIIACTSVIHIGEDIIPPELFKLWEDSGGRFVDVHNYLILELPDGDMVVDATWPSGSQKFDLRVNEKFIPGQNQQIACTPIQIWTIPEASNPQEFKQELLRKHFTPAELAFREAFIHAIGEWMAREKGE